MGGREFRPPKGYPVLIKWHEGFRGYIPIDQLLTLLLDIQTIKNYLVCDCVAIFWHL